MEFESLNTLSWAAAAVILLLAGFAHGVLGLGFLMLATPLLAIMVDVRSAILITLLPSVAVNLISILRGGNWSESIGRHWPLAIMIPLGSLAGTWLLVTFDPSPLRLLLAAVILLHLGSSRVRGIQMGWIKSNLTLAYFLFGTAAGVLAGAVNVMTPLLIIFALELGMSTLAIVQVFNLCFLAAKGAQIGAFAYGGILTRPLLHATLALAFLATGALLLGMRVRDRVDAPTYRGWLRKMLWVMVVILPIQFLGDW